MEQITSLTRRVKFRANDAICSMNGFYGNPDGSRLIKSVHDGDWGSVKTSLSLGDDVNADDGKSVTALLYAIGQRYRLIDNHLKRFGGSLAMYDAAFDMDGVDLLLESKADVNHPNRHGTTPLMCATVSGQHRVVETLLEHTALINAVTHKGYTALHYAVCWRGHQVDMAKRLLDHGALINAQSSGGYTALIHAVAGYGPEAARFLLESGANPNLPDYQGNTPLHFAVEVATETADFKLVRLLLEYGAAINAKSDKDWHRFPGPQWPWYTELVDLLQPSH